MENFFSKSLYVQGLKRLKTAGIGCAVTFAVINVLAVIPSLMQKSSYQSMKVITGGMFLPLGAFIIPAVFIMVSQAFSFLDKRKDSDFYHSLPQKRVCVYLSTLASALTWSVGTLVSSLFLNILIWSQGSDYSVDFSAIFPVILGLSASAFAIAGVSILCRTITGTKSAFIFYSACLFFFPRFFMYLFKIYLEEINPSIIIEGSFWDAFSFEYSPFFPLCTFYENNMDYFGNGLFIAALFLEAFVLFAIGAYLFKNRKSELAGAKIASKKLQFLFRSVSIIPVLFFMFADFRSFDSTLIWFGIALLIHFLFDLILSKSIKTAVLNLPLFFLTLGISIAFLVSANLVSKIYIANNPKADEIESMTFTITKSRYGHKDYYGMFDVTNFSTDSDDAIKITASALKETSSGDYWAKYGEKVMFRLKNGKKVERNVMFTEEEYIIVNAEIKKEDVYKQNFSFPEWSDDAYFYLYSYSSTDYINTEISDENIYITLKSEYLSLSPEKQAEAEIRNSSVYIYLYTENYALKFNLHEDMFPETLKLLKSYSYK